jgi:hypothetical protein
VTAALSGGVTFLAGVREGLGVTTFAAVTAAAGAFTELVVFDGSALDASGAVVRVLVGVDDMIRLP